MRISSFFVTALILGFLQLTFLNYFTFFGVKPDLFLALVIIASLFFELRVAVLLSVAAGVFKDIFGLGSFGASALLFSFWSVLIAKIYRKITIEGNLAAALLLFIIALLQNIASGFLAVYSGSFIPFGIFVRIVVLGAVYTALPLPLILKIAKTKI